MRIVSVLLLLVSVPGLLGQSRSQTQAASSCGFKEVLNPKGWMIPGLSKVEITLKHARYATEGTPPNVFVDVLKPLSTSSSVFLVSRQLSDRLEIRDQPADISSISRFSMNGHVFGYLITADLVAVTKKGERLGLGTQERVYYYDPDGSGKLTVMRYVGGEMIFKIVVPDWVRQKS